MKTFLVILATMILAGSDPAFGADPNAGATDEEFLRGYMAGEYDLIGRKADSTVTYTGRMTLRDENGALQVTRIIEGKTDKCTARFDTVAGTDRIPVLRIHFHLDGRQYDATYRWQSDPDNYPRLPATFTWPIPSHPDLKRFFQFTNKLNAERAESLSILRAQLLMLNPG